MTTNLHVHLEPNERKRRQLSGLQPIYRSAKQLFTEHGPDNPRRLSVDLLDLASFITDFHAEQHHQGVDYTELRLSPRRFRALGFSLPDILMSAHRAVSNLTDPEVRLLLLLNRDSSLDLIDECEGAISDGLPVNFVGVDLAGDEVRFPHIAKLKRLFHKARAAGLGVTVHAGEFGDVNSVWQAIDELGAERIGHGTSAGGCSALATRLRADEILIEVSVTSNVALGAVSTLESHPLPWFVENNVLACLNTDIPLHLGTNMLLEQEAARRILSSSRRALEAMEMSARVKSFRNRSSKDRTRIDG